MRLTNPETKLKLSDTKRYDLQDHKMFEKLKELEDIEERYGIEILTVYKAMVDGCYYLYNGKIEHFIPDERNFICPDFDNRSMDLMYASTYENACHVGACLSFNSYGMRWALTREELEGDR